MRKSKNKRPSSWALTFNWIFSALCLIYFFMFLPSLASYLFLGIAIFSAPPFRGFIVKDRTTKMVRIAACGVLFVVACGVSPEIESSTATTRANASISESSVTSVSTAAPTLSPTNSPVHTQAPTPEPTEAPTPTPTAEPTPEPTEAPVPTEISSPSTTVEQNQVTQSTGNQALVWIPTHGGSKYHSNPSCSNMVGPIQVTVDDAIEQGFTPCKKCY